MSVTAKCQPGRRIYIKAIYVLPTIDSPTGVWRFNSDLVCSTHDDVSWARLAMGGASGVNLTVLLGQASS